MSWDRYEFDEQSSCACGKGIVVKHCYREDDDWNRSREGCTGIDIQCHECKSKYHYDSITRHYCCPSWKGDGVYTSEYLVPNGLKIPEVMNHDTIAEYKQKEDKQIKQNEDMINKVISESYELHFHRKD